MLNHAAGAVLVSVLSSTEECGKCRLHIRDRQGYKVHRVLHRQQLSAVGLLWFKLIMFGLVSLMFSPFSCLL